MRNILAICVLMALPVLGACALPAIANNTIGAFDKSVSLKRDQDCSVLYLIDGAPYCRERLVPDHRKPVYCYRTMGGVDCYAEKDPYGSAQSGRVRPPQPLSQVSTPEATPQTD
jgi:hypothetical protein